MANNNGIFIYKISFLPVNLSTKKPETNSVAIDVIE